MDRNSPPWNVSQLARDLARERPAHTYASYQTFLQKNMLDRLHLQQRLRDAKIARGEDPKGVHVQRTTRARTRAVPTTSGRPRVAGGMSVGELHAAFAPRSSSIESLDELESGESESEEEEMDEADLLRFEERQTHTDEPRPTPAKVRKREAFTLDDRELLLRRLGELLGEVQWERDDAPPELGAPFWASLEQAAPRHSARSWMLHFERSARQYWRTAMDRCALRLSPSSVFYDGQEGSEEPEDEASEPEDEAPEPSDEPEAANEPDEDAADAADVESAMREGHAPVDSPSTPHAPLSAVPRRLTPSVTPRRAPQDTPTGPDSSADVSALVGPVQTPPSQEASAAYTPYSVRVGQRRDHHDAKATARKQQAHLPPPAAPSPLDERANRTSSPLIGTLPRSAPRPTAAAAPSPSPVRRVRHSLTALPEPAHAWRSSAFRAPQYAVEQRRARAEYEARVWELCSDFALTSPAQLVPFMEPEEGDIDGCRRRLEAYLDSLADYYDTERTTILELLEAQLGSFEQVVRVLDIQQRSLERSFERSRSMDRSRTAK